MLRALSPVPTWMVWNTMLALVPLALSFTLFSPGRRCRSMGWWFGFAVFVAALPNAPYVLTDVIHLVDDARLIGARVAVPCWIHRAASLAAIH